MFSKGRGRLALGFCGFGLDRSGRWVCRCVVILGLGKAGGGLEYVGC